jgi:carbon monoxide dehydrogenase subunit G
MEIEGTYTLQAPPEAIWRSLGDRQTLLAAIPGVERLECIDDATYALTINIKQPLLRGTYSGKVTITERQSPYHCRILIENDGFNSHNGLSNALQGDGVLFLNQRDELTIIAYQGTLQIGRHGTRLPVSISKGATKLIVQQLFTGLADQLRTSAHSAESLQATNGQHTLEVPETHLPANSLVLPPPPPEPAPPNPPSLLTISAQYIVRLLRLGGNNQQEAARWVERIRRTSILTGLLFLVWVGTRLPRR